MKHTKNYHLLALLLLFWGVLLLAACTAVTNRPEQNEPTSVPALVTQTTSAMAVASASPTVESTATTTATEMPSPTSTATRKVTDAADLCYDAAAFIADVTIPDNSQLAPRTGFIKTWRVQNSGTCTWNGHYQLVHSGGSLLGALDSHFALPASVAPGQTLDLNVSMVSPADAGTYQSDWQLLNPQGVRFGVGPHNVPLWVKLVVATPQPVKQSSISGFAWQDQDFDNQVEDGEMLPGVVITLAADANCGTFLKSATTDGNGRFQFSNLAAGDYCLIGTDGSVTVSQSNIILSENQELINVNVNWPPVWPEPASISGWLWDDYCALHTGDDGFPVVDGHCVEDGSGGYVADGMIQPEETYIAGVTVKLKSGSCVGDTLSEQLITQTNSAGQYSFEGLQPGIYCVFVDAAETTNAAILHGGIWTFPGYDAGYHEINLIAGEQAAPVNFGWDYAEINN